MYRGRPSDADLIAFLLGDLDPAAAAAVTSWVESHPAAPGFLRNLCPRDALTDDLPVAARTDLPPGPSGEAFLAALPAPGAADTDADQTAAHNTPAAGAAGRPADLAGLLRPAGAPGELGRVGGYRVLRVLGKGGMGVVCLGEDPHLRRPVAIKLIRPGRGDDTQAAAWFLREARALAALTHENIVTVFQGGQDGNTLFLAMEYLEGETVADWMHRTPRRPLGDVLRAAREAADGLAYAHAKGVVHRDLKPQNLWRVAGGGRVKLIDFGLARDPNGETLTGPGAVLGTPAYMAPEQAAGAPADHRADLFGLGCVLYELVTGRSPFARPRAPEALAAVRGYDPPPLDRAYPWLPTELVRLTDRLLAKSPAARVQSAAEVAETLRRLEGSPAGLLTRPVGEPDPAVVPAPAPTKARARRRLSWAAGLAAAALAAVGLGQFVIPPPPEDGKNEEVAVGKDGKLVPPPGKKEAKPVVFGPKGVFDFVTPPKVPDVVVPAGAALGPLALTQKPRVFEGAGGSWTLETTTHRHPVLGFAFQPKGGRVAVASADGTVRLYDAKTWAFQKAVVPPVPVGSLAWTPDGKQLITVPAHAAAAGPVGKGAVLAWDADAAKAVQEFTAFAGRQYAAPVAVSADGKWVAVATAQFGAGPGGKYKFAVEVAKLGEGGEPVELVFEDAQAVGVSWGPAAAQDKPPVLAVGYRNGDIRLWDLGKDRPEIVRTLGTGTPELKRVAWSPDGKKLAAHAGGKLVVWFGEKRLDLTGGDDFAWSPTGDRLAAALGHLGVRVYDTTAPGGKFTDLKVPALRVAWSPDGKALAVTHLGGMEVRLHDPASGKLLHAIPATDGLAFNADEGFFREPKGNNPFVFVVQTEKGQETLTPEAFGKRTGWKNDPDKVFLIGK